MARYTFREFLNLALGIILGVAGCFIVHFMDLETVTMTGTVQTPGTVVTTTDCPKIEFRGGGGPGPMEGGSEPMGGGHPQGGSEPGE